MTDPLAPARSRASSRLAPPPTPVLGMLVHAGVVAAWVALFLLAFGHGGILAWSIGLAYLFYDAALQVFTARRASLGAAAVPTVIEPVTFRLLLHSGALLGWLAFLGGAQRWGRQQRFGLPVGEAPSGP